MANRLPAFPEQFNEWRSGQTGLIFLPGMSRHLWVATQLLKALLGRRRTTELAPNGRLIDLAWQYADAMIATDEAHEQGGGQ